METSNPAMPSSVKDPCAMETRFSDICKVCLVPFFQVLVFVLRIISIHFNLEFLPFISGRRVWGLLALGRGWRWIFLKRSSLF